MYGRDFIVKTDHTPLRWLNETKNQCSRRMRWALRLLPFSYIVQYIKGKDNFLADVLSLAIIRSFLGLFSSGPRSFLPYFVLLYYYDSSVYFLLFHPCCSHVQGTLYGIHTSGMGSPSLQPILDGLLCFRPLSGFVPKWFFYFGLLM